MPVILLEHLSDVCLPDVVLSAHDLLEAAFRYEANFVFVQSAETMATRRYL